MASAFLKKLAEKSAKRQDEQYGENAYGGTKWLNSSPDNGGGTQRQETRQTETPKTRASTFLTRKAQEAAKRIDEQYGEDAYGGTKWSEFDKESAYNNWQKDLAAFSAKVIRSYNDLAYYDTDGYQRRDIIERLYNEYGAEAASLRNRADSYRNYFTDNQSYYDNMYGAGTTAAFLDRISLGSNALDSMLENLNSEYNYWSSFETEDQYNEHMRLSNYDLDAARKELEELLPQLEEAEEARNNAYLRIDPANTHLSNPNAGANLADIQSRYNELNDRVNALRQDIYNAENLQKAQNYAALMQAPDFEIYSKQDAAGDLTLDEDEKGLFYSMGETLGGKNPASYMTDDEIAIYNYLYFKEGKQAAQEYLDFIWESLSKQSGAELAARVQGGDNWLDRFLGHGVYSIAGGLNQFASGIGQLFSEERLHTTPIQFANQELAEDLDGLGYYAFQAGTTVGNMLPSIIAATATGGIGGAAGLTAQAAATAGKVAGALTMGASASGNAYNQALSEGYTSEQARNYGLAVGASEASLQYVLGGIGALGGIADDALLAKVGMIDSALARIFLTGSIKLGSEVAEEELQLFLEPAFRKIIFGEDYELPEVQEMLETALVTAISTGLLEGNSILSAAKKPQTEITAKPETPALPEAPNQPLLPEYIEPTQEEVQEAAQESTTPAQRDDLVLDEETPTQTENALRMDESATEAERAFEEAIAEYIGEPVTETVNHNDETETVEPTQRETIPERATEPITEQRTEETVTDAATEIESRAVEAAFEAGKNNVPREMVTLETPAQEEAYNSGRIEHIKNMKPEPATETVAKNETVAEPQSITAKENVSESIEKTDEQEYNVSENASYSPAAQRLYDKLSEVNEAEVDGLRYAVKQDKKTGKFFGNIKRKPVKAGGDPIENARGTVYSSFTPGFATREEALADLVAVAQNNKLLLEVQTDGGSVDEVSDEAGVLEPVSRRQSDGGVLDEVSAEDVREDESGRDAVQDAEGGRRPSAGHADRPDASGDGRGRSVGNREGGNLQSSAGEVNHAPLNTTEELDKAVLRGSGFENGEKRIFEFYKKNPSPAAAIEFLKKEYGTGGWSHDLTDGTRGFLSHDAKGLELEVNGEKHTFTWKAVDKRIRALIADGKYAPELAAAEVAEESTVTEPEETLEAEVETKAELATQEEPRGVNFTIPEKGLQLPNGEKARFKANVAAIKTLRTLMAENRRATPAEQEILSKYVGWGGLANAFDEKKPEWAKEYKQLKALLTDKEYNSARGSTLNAHYTDVNVIRAIYNGLSGIGFQGGRLLEPSAGVGHFAGAMPTDIPASWMMVELDEITGNIAKYLYPNADVRVQGFENANIPDNYMDAAISNVPFGNYAIADKSYPKAVTSAIHNYFFAKSLDKVRPGGIVCFITSRYTMDAANSDVRHYIAQRADLLGAIRLPNSAFKGNAGTEVVTDILVLKKREPGTAYGGEAFEKSNYHHQALGIWEATNDYFAEHPEMVLGTAESTSGMYRSSGLTYSPKPGNLAKQIEKAFSTITGKMDYPVQPSQEEIRKEIKANAGKAKNGAIVAKDGKLYRNNNGVLETATDVDAKNEATVAKIVDIRDTARKLLDAQLDGLSDKEITAIRRDLNAKYDDFVKKHGILNSVQNTRLARLDVDSPFILALENYDKETKKASKADIFTKNTITPNQTITHVNTIEEGLVVSVNETGGVDVDRIAELLGESAETVKGLLLKNRLAFKNRNGNLETAEKYLSGNVKAKLRDAEALAEGDPDYNANVEELKKIIPADIPAEDISVQPGVTWIPDSIYSDFAAETLGSNNKYRKNVAVTYNKVLGEFSVTINDAWLKHRPENTSTWGTPDRSFANILEATLNSKSVTVTRKTEDGSRYVDKQATAAAQEKQEKIRAEFKRWLWDNDERKATLTTLYNDVFNNSVTPKYDGSNLVVNGSNAAKPLRAHQRDAVQRIISSGGNTLLAHKVGAGKTYEMAAAAMKLRQLGIVRKPMFVVPKPLVAQWGAEFLDFFPAAKILVLGDKDFSAANRKLFANRIATGDYDAVILSQEQFKAVPMSIAAQEAFYQEQITALELAKEEAARKNGKRAPSIKQMERSKKSLEAKLKKLGDMKKDADNIDFEQLGVDALFVDEAHSYKNLFYTTNMQNVSGLGNKDGSQKAFDLYMKVRYLQKLNGGRGIVFATATPVMNSMSEMYIMQKYLQGDLLESRWLDSFDAWANQFGEVRTVLEMNPSGKGFRQKQSFSRFKNLAELQQMFRAFADVLTDIPGLKIPTMKEGKRIIVESDPSDFQMEFIDKLAERADAIKGRLVDPKEDNMLKVTSEGRKLSYTQRMIDPSLPYEEGNKIMKCADNVLQIWKDSKGTKGTQLIFCDLSTPKGSSNTETTTEETDVEEDISIYDDIKNALVGAGVPAKEVAFIHDANTNEKKKKLFQDVNDGKVRVLIGSTGKMGVGMNAQKRIVALHHLDAPWRPGDIEQREGRALRQGNMNEEVGIYVYATKKTFDSRMWDNLQRKASFIHQIMAGDLTARDSEGDGDFALSAAEIKAIASGNPLIMEQFEVAAELSKLETLEKAHAKEVSDAKKQIAKNTQTIASDTLFVERLRADIATRKDTTGDKFSVTIGKNTITDRKAAGKAIIDHAKKHLNIARTSETTHSIGRFAGFELLVTNGGDVLLKGQGQYRTAVNMQSEAGTIQSLEALAKRLDKTLEVVETQLSESKAAISKLEKIARSPFDKAGDLLNLRKRNAEILAELNPDSEKNVAELDDDGDDVEYSRETSSGSTHPEEWEARRTGDTEKAPKPLSEIIEGIRHEFGINITTGHVRGAGVRGLYDKSSKGIRSKIANDLPTVSHELGHALNDRYGLIKGMTPEMKTELEEALGEKKDIYSKKKWHREGFAEFVRLFLQNRETAAIDFPEVTNYLLQKLSGKDRYQLEQLADDVNAYYSLDAYTATSSIKLAEEKAPDARTISEKIRAKMSAIYQAWVDSNHGIKLFDRATGANTYKLASNAAYSDAIAGQIITGDLTDANGQYVGPGLKTVLHGLDLNNLEEYKLFGEYLVVRHGPERLAEGLRVFADDRKNSTRWMNFRMAEIETQRPDFVEIANRLYDFQRQFLETWGVETNLVSAETAEEWAIRWQYYVPLNRVIGEDGGGGAKRGFANQNSTIKKAHGSGLDITQPVDNIIKNIVKMVNAGVRNNVMVKITEQAADVKANAMFLEKVPAPLKVTKVDMATTKEKLIEMLEGSDMETASKAKAGEVVNSLEDILFQYGRGKAYGDVITVLKNGAPEFWKINDPQLLQSLTNMTPTTMDGILDAYAVVSRFMTSNITGNNLLWSIFSNAPRDAMTLFTYSKNKNIAEMAKGVGSAYLNKLRGDNADPLFKEFLAMGGGQTSAYTSDRDLAKKARKKLAGKNFSANPLDYISFISDTVESGPRFATYRLARQSGMDPQEAFYAAMDITVNFRRAGRLGRELNKVVPFFNANMQGLDKFRRWITAEEAAGKENRKHVVNVRLAGFVTASAVLAAVSYALNNYDDEAEEEYEDLSTFVKNSYWNIPKGNGKYFTIPKPREIGVLSSLFERALEATVGDNDHAWDEFFAYASENFLPAILNDIAQVGDNGLVETGMNIIGSFGMLGVISYLGANRDFLGRPIVSSGLQRLEPKDQYTNSTSKIAYWIGQATGGSPQQIDYFFQQILGGWWKYQKALFPVGDEKIDLTLGVKNTYVKDNLYSTDIVNRLYDRADETAKAKASDPTNIEKALAAKWDSLATNFYGSYYKLAKDKRETDDTRSVRRLVLDMIKDYERIIEKGTQPEAWKAVEDVCVSKGSTEYLPSVMDVSVTDGNKTEHALSEMQYFEYQTDYLRLYWEYVEESLPVAKTDSEKAAVLLAAKQIAREEATNRTLARIGAKQTDYFDKYDGVDAADLVMYKAHTTVANEDGKVNQSEVIDILETMLDSGLPDDDAWTLYLSRYSPESESGYNKDGTLNAIGVRDAGVDAETWLEFKENLNNLEYEAGKQGARKTAFEEMLEEMGIDDETYAILFGTEYKTDSGDSGGLFGSGGAFGGGSMFGE